MSCRGSVLWPHMKKADHEQLSMPVKTKHVKRNQSVLTATIETVTAGRLMTKLG